MNNNTPIDGASLDVAVRAFSPEIMQVLEGANRVLNGFIGLTILLVLVLLFLHLIRWAVYGSHNNTGRASISGAIRAFIALFLMIDIWALIRVVQLVVDITPAFAYLIVIGGAVLLAAWSLLGIGDVVIDAIIRGVRFFVDTSIARIRATKHPSRIVKYFKSRSDAVLRFFVLLAMTCAVTVISLFWTFSGVEHMTRPVVFRDEPPDTAVYAIPPTHEEEDAEIRGTTYINHHYGIEVTYPEGWILEVSTSSHTLLMAYPADRELYSQLNAGMFEDTIDGSHDAYLTALWRIEKHVFGEVASLSAGIFRSGIVDHGDIGYSSSTLIAIDAYWPFEGQRTDLVSDRYLVLRNNPVFFTLQMRAWGNTTADELADTLTSVSQSIRLTPLTQ